MKIQSAALLACLLSQTAAFTAFIPSSRHDHAAYITRCSASKNEANDKKRRTLFDLAATLPFLGRRDANAAATSAAANVNNDGPIADFPMRRLQLPKGGIGRSYILIQLYIQNTGPYDFMVDSGLTTELITPHLQSLLHLPNAGVSKQGLSAGAVGVTQSLVELKNVSLCGSSGSGEERFDLPPLTAIVTDFPQEHMDPSHDPVEGMLGMEVLEQFDVDFDFPMNRLRLWRPGSFDKVAKNVEGMAAIDAVVVNETRLLGFRVASADVKGKDGEVSTQPYLGLVDCGSSFSIVNWAAAPYLGLPPKGDAAYQKNPQVQGMGVDGLPQVLPTYKVQLSYVGDPVQASQQTMTFQSPAAGWKAWDPISIAIGDLPVFTQLLGDGRTPYKGPAGIIGLDVLSQRRVALETSSGRKRKIWVGKS
ncbi:hypothetical protein ACHAWO_013277 [Cyclotella atomus]|uniref:Peptidase A2 domain-containing protein n=1 Tax=Cyclotella atomus TaxID=382360 RepID=A0ABD3NRH8_9STRA